MNSADLIPNGVPLASIPGLTVAQIKTLADAWIMTAQELVALHHANDALRNRLAAALGLSRTVLAQLAAAAEALIPPTRDLHSLALAEEAAQAEYGLGALLDEPPEVLAARDLLPEYVPPSGRLVLRESTDLLDQLPPVRNQGGRGTCVAHAVLGVREQLELAAGAPRDLNLSEQYVYWWCKAHDGIPVVSGTYVSVGMRCLANTGAPLEAMWPYVSVEKQDQGQGPPPAAAANGDPAFRTLRTQEFNRADITGIKTCLAEGRAVAFSVPVFDSWYASSATSRWGKLTLPLPGEGQNGGHAMTLVGYQDDAGAPGGGFFLVRNSWQPWSWDGVWREGYGYIPYAYITRFATAVFSGYRLAGAMLSLRDSVGEASPRVANELTWNSPDLWLRPTTDDGTEHQPPAAPGPAAVYVRAFNRGPAYAYDVTADLFAAPAAPHIRPGEWQRVGRLRAPWLPPGETVLGPLHWTQPGAGPRALLVRLGSAEARADDTFDPAASDRIAQRNCWFAEARPGETVEVAFDLTPAANKQGGVSLRLERGDLPPEADVSPIRIGPARHDDPEPAESRGLVEEAVLGAVGGAVVLGAGQRRQASLAIALPTTAAPGARYSMAVVQLQGGEVVGRLTLQIDVVAA